MLKSILFAGVASILAALPAQAKEWKEIKIATEGAYPPFNFVAADGSLQGLDVDIAKALCAAMEAKCEIVANDWDGMIPGLQANKFDAVIASMSVTEERQKQVSLPTNTTRHRCRLLFLKTARSLRSMLQHSRVNQSVRRDPRRKQPMPKMFMARPVLM